MSLENVIVLIDVEIQKLQQARSLLTGNTSHHHTAMRKRHKMSAAARTKIAAAQRARWAKVRAAKKRK